MRKQMAAAAQSPPRDCKSTLNSASFTLTPDDKRGLMTSRQVFRIETRPSGVPIPSCGSSAAGMATEHAIDRKRLAHVRSGVAEGRLEAGSHWAPACQETQQSERGGAVAVRLTGSRMPCGTPAGGAFAQIEPQVCHCTPVSPISSPGRTSPWLADGNWAASRICPVSSGDIRWRTAPAWAWKCCPYQSHGTEPPILSVPQSPLHSSQRS
ncbi:hypothetical protein QBC47DRAFT_57085 [Echria macrotheca]|uniref:Uncharacterized protein n=1 Tax=Echria macrotheca TaxID=438768 RepID=A0AAJ0F3M0_9PEZI|nr:hypothetical protein QBC47DRAFT_57085 [Echria macrotheca]